MTVFVPHQTARNRNFPGCLFSAPICSFESVHRSHCRTGRSNADKFTKGLNNSLDAQKPERIQSDSSHFVTRNLESNQPTEPSPSADELQNSPLHALSLNLYLSAFIFVLLLVAHFPVNLPVISTAQADPTPTCTPYTTPRLLHRLRFFQLALPPRGLAPGVTRAPDRVATTIGHRFKAMSRLWRRLLLRHQAMERPWNGECIRRDFALLPRLHPHPLRLPLPGPLCS